VYFYVFLQPEVFEETAADGDDAIQNLAGILTGFLQNCFLAVFEDDRWKSSIRERIEQWPETMSRRRVASLLVQLRKRNRFLYIIAPDYTGLRSDLDCVFEQASSIPLDLILVLTAEENRPSPGRVEVASRRNYQNTTFEPLRSILATDGKTCNPGDMDEVSFLDFHFWKALKYAGEIHICDRICGARNFADNYRHTIKQLMTWLSTVLADPASCKIVFHLGQPSGQGIHFILHELASFKKGRLSKTSIETYFYDDSFPNPGLPHQRFIVTNQVALNIDRGMDFFDEKTRRCRDTYVNYQNLDDAQRLLQSYSSGCISKHVI
jgi:hypothetical protein